MGSSLDRTFLYQFLSRFRYAVISSTSNNGSPQSALMGIAVTPSLEIVFDTLKTSRKYANLTQRPSCSFVIGWGAEQTVQWEGLAFEPAGPELHRYQESYFALWPECRSHLSWPEIVYLVARPTWILYSDYDQTPPRIEEMAFPPQPAPKP